MREGKEEEEEEEMEEGESVSPHVSVEKRKYFQHLLDPAVTHVCE